MTLQNDKRTEPLKLNGEDGLIKVRTSEIHSSFSSAALAEEAIFERYDMPLRVQIGRLNNSQGIDLLKNETDTTYYRDTFMWTRTGTIADIGDGKPGIWVLGFMSIQKGSFDDFLHETIEYGKSFATNASSHMDMVAVLAGEDRKNILTIARWINVGRFLETVHTAAKDKIPPTKLIKKLSLSGFNRFMAITETLSGRRSAYYPYKLIKNPVSFE